MSAGTKLGLASTAKLRNCVRMFEPLGVRHKSEPTRQIDEFPYRSMKYRDVNNMSAEMESTAKSPLRSFFAQYRPLMPFGRPPTSEESQVDDKRWVHIPMTNGRFPIFMHDDRPVWNVVPEEIAKKIGPFDRDAIKNREWNDLGNKVEKRLNYHSPYGSRSEPLTASEMQSVLSTRFPILMEHLQKMTGSDGDVKIIPLSVEKLGDEEHVNSMELTSVRRKRKLKMNRHKYRKRLKEQRTKRRRLGK